jgi:lysophospholipase L1-like esterase
VLGYDDITVINSGNSGWQSDEALASVQTKVLNYNPDLCIMMFGINDCGGSNAGGVPLSIEQFNANMTQIVEIIKNNNIDIILATPTPILSSNKNKLLLFAETSRQIAKNYNLILVDLQNNIRNLWEQKIINPSNLLPDNIHFAEGYYKYLSNEFLRVLYPLRVAKHNTGIPIGTSDCLSDCTSISINDAQFYGKNYILASFESPQTTGTYIKFPFWNEGEKDLWLIYPTTGGGKSANIRLNGEIITNVSFKTPNSTETVYDNEIKLKAKLDYGYNILEINYNDIIGGDGNIYITGIKFKNNEDDTGWIPLNLLNNVAHYATGQELAYRKIGNRVDIRGGVKNITSTNVKIAQLKPEFCPKVGRGLIFPGTGTRTNRFLLDSAGNITFQSTSYTDTLLVTDWYPFNDSFLVD